MPNPPSDPDSPRSDQTVSPYPPAENLPIRVTNGPLKCRSLQLASGSPVEQFKLDVADLVLTTVSNTAAAVGTVLAVIALVIAVAAGAATATGVGGVVIGLIGLGIGLAMAFIQLAEIIRDANTTTIQIVMAIPGGTVFLHKPVFDRCHGDGDVLIQYQRPTGGPASSWAPTATSSAEELEAVVVAIHGSVKGTMEGIFYHPLLGRTKFVLSFKNLLGPATDDAAKHFSASGYDNKVCRIAWTNKVIDANGYRDVATFVICPPLPRSQFGFSAGLGGTDKWLSKIEACRGVLVPEKRSGLRISNGPRAGEMLIDMTDDVSGDIEATLDQQAARVAAMHDFGPEIGGHVASSMTYLGAVVSGIDVGLQVATAAKLVDQAKLILTAPARLAKIASGMVNASKAGAKLTSGAAGTAASAATALGNAANVMAFIGAAAAATDAILDAVRESQQQNAIQLIIVNDLDPGATIYVGQPSLRRGRVKAGYGASAVYAAPAGYTWARAQQIVDQVGDVPVVIGETVLFEADDGPAGSIPIWIPNPRATGDEPKQAQVRFYFNNPYGDASEDKSTYYIANEARTLLGLPLPYDERACFVGITIIPGTDESGAQDPRKDVVVLRVQPPWKYTGATWTVPVNPPDPEVPKPTPISLEPGSSPEDPNEPLPPAPLPPPPAPPQLQVWATITTMGGTLAGQVVHADPTATTASCVAVFTQPGNGAWTRRELITPDDDGRWRVTIDSSILIQEVAVGVYPAGTSLPATTSELPVDGLLDAWTSPTRPVSVRRSVPVTVAGGRFVIDIEPESSFADHRVVIYTKTGADKWTRRLDQTLPPSADPVHIEQFLDACDEVAVLLVTAAFDKNFYRNNLPSLAWNVLGVYRWDSVALPEVEAIAIRTRDGVTVSGMVRGLPWDGCEVRLLAQEGGSWLTVAHMSATALESRGTERWHELELAVELADRYAVVITDGADELDASALPRPGDQSGRVLGIYEFPVSPVFLEETNREQGVRELMGHWKHWKQADLAALSVWVKPDQGDDYRCSGIVRPDPLGRFRLGIPASRDVAVVPATLPFTLPNDDRSLTRLQTDSAGLCGGLEASADAPVDPFLFFTERPSASDSTATIWAMGMLEGMAFRVEQWREEPSGSWVTQADASVPTQSPELAHPQQISLLASERQVLVLRLVPVGTGTLGASSGAGHPVVDPLAYPGVVDVLSFDRTAPADIPDARIKAQTGTIWDFEPVRPRIHVSSAAASGFVSGLIGPSNHSVMIYAATPELKLAGIARIRDDGSWSTLIGHKGPWWILVVHAFDETAFSGELSVPPVGGRVLAKEYVERSRVPLRPSVTLVPVPGHVGRYKAVARDLPARPDMFDAHFARAPDFTIEPPSSFTGLSQVVALDQHGEAIYEFGDDNAMVRVLLVPRLAAKVYVAAGIYEGGYTPVDVTSETGDPTGPLDGRLEAGATHVVAASPWVNRALGSVLELPSAAGGLVRGTPEHNTLMAVYERMAATDKWTFAGASFSDNVYTTGEPWAVGVRSTRELAVLRVADYANITLDEQLSALPSPDIGSDPLVLRVHPGAVVGRALAGARWFDAVGSGQPFGSFTKRLKRLELELERGSLAQAVELSVLGVEGGWSPWTTEAIELDRMLKVRARLIEPEAQVQLEYRCFTAKQGWQPWVLGGQAAGRDRKVNDPIRVMQFRMCWQDAVPVEAAPAATWTMGSDHRRLQDQTWKLVGLPGEACRMSFDIDFGGGDRELRLDFMARELGNSAVGHSLVCRPSTDLDDPPSSIAAIAEQNWANYFPDTPTHTSNDWAPSGPTADQHTVVIDAWLRGTGAARVMLTLVRLLPLGADPGPMNHSPVLGPTSESRVIPAPLGRVFVRIADAKHGVVSVSKVELMRRYAPQ